MRVFVDTNMFLRFFTDDDSGQSAKAEKLFHDAAKGKLRLVTGPPVLFEMAWTLKRSYGVAPDQILTLLEAVAAMPGLDLLDDVTVRLGLTLAREHHMDFADAYIAATVQVERLGALATFNARHFRTLGMKLLPAGITGEDEPLDGP